MTDVLRKCDWHVLPINRDAAWRLVATHHYAGGGSNTMTHGHGLFRRDEPFVCRGAAWWLPPTRAAAEATWDGPFTEVLSLSRLVLTPDVPKNGATFLLMASVRQVRQDHRWRCLVTYADTWQGHTGHIYRVAGWEYLGLTEPEEVWVDAIGRMVCRKAGPKTRTRQEMIDLGHRSLGKHPKHKYRLVLPPPRPYRTRTLFGVEG